MFDGKYFDWNQKRIKGIVDYFGYKFFYGKKIADLGCGYADLSGVLYRLGSEITAIDARQEHLKIVSKKFPGIKVVRSNLEGPWPLFGQKFDIILDLGLLCHLSSYESHLKSVCATTTHLILETAVCDSDDCHKHIQVPEGKEIYDLSFNGTGCRPTAAAIERVLTECGMNFKRMDSAKFNSGDYTYDWAPKNDGSTSLNKRRMWFATKNTAGVITPFIGTQPAVLVQAPPAAPNFAYGQNPVPSSFLGPNTNSPAVLTASPRPPMSANTRARLPSTPGQYTPNNYVEHKDIALNTQVTKNSREFSLVMPENYTPPTTYQNFGVIFPNTPSSRTWMRKVLPLFPNIMVSSRAFTMTGFRKSDDPPHVVMCSIDSLMVNKRIWIEEWNPGSLNSSHIDILKQCKHIVTPSLINAQEILKELPEADIIRVEKPWPMIEAPVIKYDYFLYFEKNESLTQILLDSWDDKFGKLIVIGSRIKLSTFAEYVSDGASYNDVTSLLMGAKAVIDLSENTYYMSGILKLAHSYSLTIISNNQSYANLDNSVLINQQNGTTYPTKEDIHKAISRFVIEMPKVPARYNTSYNDEAAVSIQKIIGV